MWLTVFHLNSHPIWKLSILSFYSFFLSLCSFVPTLCQEKGTTCPSPPPLKTLLKSLPFFLRFYQPYFTQQFPPITFFALISSLFSSTFVSFLQFFSTFLSFSLSYCFFCFKVAFVSHMPNYFEERNKSPFVFLYLGWQLKLIQTKENFCFEL